MKLIVLAFATLCLYSSCTIRITPSNYENLPKVSSQGYAGSRAPISLTPWIYRGSDKRGHHFQYTWIRDNSVFDRNVITGDSAPVDQPFPLTDNRSKWQSAEPILGADGKLKGFATTPFYQTEMNRVQQLFP